MAIAFNALAVWQSGRCWFPSWERREALSRNDPLIYGMVKHGRALDFDCPTHEFAPILAV